MELLVSSGGIPLPMGQYAVRLDTIKDSVPRPKSEREDYGPSVDVYFTVLSGEFVGQQVSQLWTKKMSDQSNLGKFAIQLSGKPLVGKFDFAPYFGTVGFMIVGPNNAGTASVQSFTPNPQATQAAPVQPVQQVQSQPMPVQPQDVPLQSVPAVPQPQQVVQPQAVQPHQVVPNPPVQQPATYSVEPPVAQPQGEHSEAVPPQPPVTPPPPPLPAE